MSRQYLGQLLRATRGARNPNLQVVITHASHVCSLHSFGLPLRMNGMHRTQFDRARFDLRPLVIWSRVFWPSVTRNLHKASTAMEQKRLDLWSLSPALPNLWLLLVLLCLCRSCWVLVEFHKFSNLNRAHRLFHPRYFENALELG